MGHRHRALVVEDDTTMAAALGVLLESIGHDHVAVTNRADAEAALAEHEFCYVLLDLQIKANPDLIEARVEAGQSVLELIRERYPHTDNVGRHLLQVLVVSAHAKEPDYVAEVFQSGADDVVQKPVGRTLKKKIQDALSRSGRQKHACCDAVTAAARGAGIAEPAGATDIAIVGRAKDKQFELQVGGTTMWLTFASLLLLVRLYAARLRSADGWAHKNADLKVQNDQGWKGMNRLKEQLARYLPPETKLVENDHHGSYRLHPSIVIKIDTAQLQAVANSELTEVVLEIEQMLAVA